MIGQIIAFIVSPFAMLAWLLGFVGYIMMPMIPKLTDEFPGFARYPVGLAMGMLERAAILVSEHDDILLKRMSFDGLGVETITIDGERKEFEDPDGALHSFMGVPFALADEVHGLLFDPRHSALGARKRADRERNENIVKATDYEWEHDEVSWWYKGLYEFPRDVYELVDLSAVRELVDGGERAEYPQRVEREYEHSRSPFASDMSNLRIILLIVAMIGPFMIIWLGVWQFGKPDSTLSFGVLAVLITSIGADIEYKRIGLALALVAVPLAAIGFSALFLGPVLAVAVGVTMLLGWAFLPFLSLLARPSARLANRLSTIFWKHGMLGYDRPVFVWTPRRYELREFEELDATADVSWYTLDGQTVGFTFTPDDLSWGAEVVDADTVKAKRTVPDGGSADTNIPPGYAKAPTITRADGKYGAFVPKRMRSDHYYLNSAIAKARFVGSADGSKSVSRLLWAKENKTENDGTDERRLMFMVMGMSLISFVTGILVFFVLL